MGCWLSLGERKDGQRGLVHDYQRMQWRKKGQGVFAVCAEKRGETEERDGGGVRRSA